MKPPSGRDYERVSASSPARGRRSPPAGADAMDPTGAGGGSIGVGQAPVPGEQGFSANGQGNRELLSKLKPLVGNNRQWDHFSKYLDNMIDQHHKVLEQSENMITVHKAQGAIDVLRKIKRLREDVANAEG